MLHGNATYLLQDDDGQIDRGALDLAPGSTIRASGRSMPGCKDIGRVEYVSVTDDEALDAFRLCSEPRASSPRSSRRMRSPSGQDRAGPAERPSDRHEPVRARRQGHLHRGGRDGGDSVSDRIERALCRACRRPAAAAWSPSSAPAIPTRRPRPTILAGLPAAGADLIELGMPFTDPMADGPAIQAGSLRALKAGMTLARTLDLVRDFRGRRRRRRRSC